MTEELLVLKENLDDACDTFSLDCQMRLSEQKIDSDIKSAIDTMQQQTFYALDSFKNAILEYLGKI